MEENNVSNSAEFAFWLMSLIQDEALEPIAYEKYLSVCVAENKFNQIESWKICRLFQKYFIRTQCRDETLLISFMEAFSINYEIRLQSLFCMDLFSPPHLVNVLRAAKKERFNLWGLWNSSNEAPKVIQLTYNPSLRCLVNDAIALRRMEKLQVLLDHGFHRKKDLQYSLIFLIVRDHFEGNSLQFKAIVETLDHRAHLVMETFYFNNGCHHFDFDPDVLSLAWKSIPDPYVKAEEMISIMLKIIDEKHHAKAIDSIISYSLHFPEESQGPFGPRRLMHLCRCSLRSALMDAWQMPEGVACLPLPPRLQEYLLLKCCFKDHYKKTILEIDIINVIF